VRGVGGQHCIGTGGYFRRPLAAVMLPALLLAAAPAAASWDLYSATVIVTGRDNLSERARGIREALPLVLTKLTVDSELAERAVSEGLTDGAEALVERFDYVDRKEGIQISDEQGTRERSFELTVSFDRQMIDAIVGKLGGTTWTGERPEIGVVLVVDDGATSYLLTRSSEKGYGQRLALNDRAKALALPVMLPDAVPAGATLEVALAKVGLTSPVRLEGRMTITPAGYWNTEWWLKGEGLDERFATADTTFDVAFDEALRHSAKALAKR
jgi:hypothetical protein